MAKLHSGVAKFQSGIADTLFEQRGGWFPKWVEDEKGAE
jgi:hypothetical protein